MKTDLFIFKSNLIFIKLVPSKGSHTRFDASGSQSNEE